MAELIYDNTVPAKFIRRLNRFSAEVELDGMRELVHVKNTGRLGELLVPGADVCLQHAANPSRKTRYDLISVYKTSLAWVNIDSNAPNKLVRQYLEEQGYDLVKPEYTYGDSRLDFYMERTGAQHLPEVEGCPPADEELTAERYLAEVEGCPLADEELTAERYLAEVKGCTLADEELPGFGRFPDAPTERGVRHLRELARAAREGFRCSIIFVIQMNGIHTVLPNDKTHPEFGAALAEAARAGVEVICLPCSVEADRIRISDRGEN